MDIIQLLLSGGSTQPRTSKCLQKRLYDNNVTKPGLLGHGEGLLEVLLPGNINPHPPNSHGTPKHLLKHGYIMRLSVSCRECKHTLSLESKEHVLQADKLGNLLAQAGVRNVRLLVNWWLVRSERTKNQKNMQCYSGFRVVSRERRNRMDCREESQGSSRDGYWGPVLYSLRITWFRVWGFRA